MGKRGPKKGISKWHWHVIKRVRDGKYYVGSPSPQSYRFSPDIKSAPAWRLKEAYSMLCRIRRTHRMRERYRIQGKDGAVRRARATFFPPETFVLEVLGDPKAKINYPWRMPM